LVDEPLLERPPEDYHLPKVKAHSTEELRTHLRGGRTLWCAGCTNGIVTRAMIDAFLSLGLDAEKVTVIAGIGCAGRITSYLDYSTVHTAHGRALAVASGAKLADPELDVVVVMGDGDCAAIGGNHLIHAARRNVDLTALIFNNQIYGMTGGQAGPTTPEGDLSKTSPFGNPEPAFDICELAWAAGATYVARATAYNYLKLVALIAGGIQHKGFSLVEAVSDCPTYYGRMNLGADAPTMLAAQKDQAVTIERYDLERDGIVAGRYPVGVLHHVERQEFIEAYDELRKRAGWSGGPANGPGVPERGQKP
jgi:2-oxoglutarate/2-oxoacid ferredoxin oxidoreductase subunit beta